MSVITGEYALPKTERIIFRPGAVRNLRQCVEALGGTRVLLITGRTLARETDIPARVAEALAPILVEIVSGTRAHVPLQTVFDIAARVREVGADVLVSLGGGSPIDTAKAVAAVLAEGIEAPEDLDRLTVKFTFPNRLEVPRLAGRPIPHVAIPTTLSAAEFTGIVGVTDTERGFKKVIIDPALTPKIAILDPELSLATPMWLWTSSAIRSVDHAVEAFFSPRHHPITDALAFAALETLFVGLPACRERPDDLAVRGHLQLAAGMAVWALLGAGSGLSHGIGYVLGARFGVPHGISSCVTLPHVMRFNRPVARERAADMARRLGWAMGDADEDSAAAAVERVLTDFIASLGHPTRLREVGIRETDLPALAGEVMKYPNVVNNVRPVADREELLAFLRTAW
jgi:alcohol dehydrogenase